LLLTGLLAGPTAATAATTGAVGGLRDPATGTLELTVQASENAGLGLRSASVSLGGRLLDAAPFADPGCGPGTCPEVGSVALQAPTTAVADGPQRLEVTVEDGAGQVTVLVDRTVTVANTPPTYTSSVTLAIGSNPTTGGSGGTEEPPPGGIGGEASGCRAPRLTVVLASRSVRTRRGVPLLAPGKRHRFTGRLTCHDGTRRVAASRGTSIGLRHWVRGRVARQKVLRVGTNGRFSARVRVTSRRVLAFRARSADGGIVRVRIRLGVAR
jgi:hypothetical protein